MDVPSDPVRGTFVAESAHPVPRALSRRTQPSRQEQRAALSPPQLGLSPVGDVASAVENALAAYSGTAAAPREYFDQTGSGSASLEKLQEYFSRQPPPPASQTILIVLLERRVETSVDRLLTLPPPDELTRL